MGKVHRDALHFAVCIPGVGRVVRGGRRAHGGAALLHLGQQGAFLRRKLGIMPGCAVVFVVQLHAPVGVIDVHRIKGGVQCIDQALVLLAGQDVVGRLAEILDGKFILRGADIAVHNGIDLVLLQGIGQVGGCIVVGNGIGKALFVGPLQKAVVVDLGLQKADAHPLIGGIIPCHHFAVADLDVHAGGYRDSRVLRDCELRAALIGRLGGGVQVDLAAAQHLHAFGGGLVVAHIVKGALHVLGQALHHLVAVASAPAVLILDMVTVSGVERHLIDRRLPPGHALGPGGGAETDRQYQHQYQCCQTAGKFLCCCFQLFPPEKNRKK